MSAGQVVLALAAVVLAGSTLVLAVLLARVTRVLDATRELLARLAATPPAVPAAPVAADLAATNGPPAAADPAAGDDAAEPVTAAPAGIPAGPSTDVVPAAAPGPRLGEVAAATLGPPLVRAAALGYGLRTVLAERVRPRPARRGLFGTAGTRADRQRARRRSARGRR